MTGALTGAAIRCDCGRQLVPSGGEQILRCACGRVWQALVHTRTTGATAWIRSAGSPDRHGPGGSGPSRLSPPALSVLRSIPGRIFLVPALWPADEDGGRPRPGHAWRPRLV